MCLLIELVLFTTRMTSQYMNYILTLSLQPTSDMSTNYRIQPRKFNSGILVRKRHNIVPLTFRTMPNAIYAPPLEHVNSFIWATLENLSDQRNLYNHYYLSLVKLIDDIGPPQLIHDPVPNTLI